MSLGASCKRGIEFDPDFRKGSHVEMAIVSEEGERVYCEDPAFDEYAAMHETKIMELAEILKKARMPRAEKQRALQILQKVINANP